MSDFVVVSSRYGDLRYEWKGQSKQCPWARNGIGQIDLLDPVGRQAAETKAILDHLYHEIEAGKHVAD